MKKGLPSSNCPQEVNIRMFSSSFASEALSFSRSSYCFCAWGWCCCCRCCFSLIRISFECFDSRQLSGFESDAVESFEFFELLESWLLTVESRVIAAVSMLLCSMICYVFIHHCTRLFLLDPTTFCISWMLLKRSSSVSLIFQATAMILIKNLSIIPNHFF